MYLEDILYRKRQFTIEQQLATEENPYSYRVMARKERDLMAPITILQLETLEDLLGQNNALTDKKRQFQNFKDELVKLAQERPIVIIYFYILLSIVLK